MKQILAFFVLALSVLSAGKTQAQCVPDTSITHNVNGIYPDSATGLPRATVGVPYSTVIQMKVVLDTTYNGLPATVNTFTITGVTGLPTGWTYTCTPSTCIFPGGSDACMLLEGPAPTAAQAGVYPIVVNLSVAGIVGGFVPLTIPAAITQYTVYIDNPTGISNPGSPTRFVVSDFMPNPTQAESRLKVGMPESGDVRIELMDMLGNKVRQNVYTGQKGWNTFTLDAGELRAGIYLAHILSGKEDIVRRLIITGR